MNRLPTVLCVMCVLGCAAPDYQIAHIPMLRQKAEAAGRAGDTDSAAHYRGVVADLEDRRALIEWKKAHQERLAAESRQREAEEAALRGARQAEAARVAQEKEAAHQAWLLTLSPAELLQWTMHQERLALEVQSQSLQRQRLHQEEAAHRAEMDARERDRWLRAFPPPQFLNVQHSFPFQYRPWRHSP